MSTNESNQNNSNEPDKKQVIVKAMFKGFVVGVFFMLTAVFVSRVLG